MKRFAAGECQSTWRKSLSYEGGWRGKQQKRRLSPTRMLYELEGG
jgi:hypothetical protein